MSANPNKLLQAALKETLEPLFSAMLREGMALQLGHIQLDMARCMLSLALTLLKEEFAGNFHLF